MDQQTSGNKTHVRKIIIKKYSRFSFKKVGSIYKLTACTMKQVEEHYKQFIRLSHPFKIYINEKSHIDIVKMDQKAKDAFANLRFQFQDFSLTRNCNW
jgi:hypothetical protein